jgi:FkbM family methyltransferase
MSLSPYHRLLQYTLLRVRPAFVAAWLKNLFRVKRMSAKTPQGVFWVDPVSLLGVRLTREGTFEENMILTLEKFLKPGSIFVDLGANEGYFTVIAARLCGSAGRVIAIEPQDRLQPVIKENVRLNGSPSVSVVHAAIGDMSGTVKIQLTPSTNNGGSGIGRRSNYRLPSQDVGMQTLAQVLDAQLLAEVDLMKVDIEGFEYEALLGSPQVFEQHRVKALALELHPTLLAGRGRDAADIEAMLTRCGYRCENQFGNPVWVSPV